MLKKLLLLAVVGIGAVAAIKGTRFFGYAKQELSALEDWADNQVPIEKKISHLRKEVGALDKDIDRVAVDLSKEIVAVRTTGEQLKTETAALTDAETKVRAMGEKLKDATEKVAYGTEMVSIDEAKGRLNADVKRVVVRKQTVNALTQALATREGIRDTLHKQIGELKSQKVALTAAIDELEGEYKKLQLAQMESKYQFDHTRLAKIKQQLTALKTSIEEKGEYLKLKPQTVTDASAPPANGLTVDEILAPLDGPAKK